MSDVAAAEGAQFHMREDEFTVEIFQNEYIASGGHEVSAIATVTCADEPGYVGALPASAAEIIIVDCSSSMHEPKSKIIQARQATEAAIDAIRDSVAFAVIAGTDHARVVYPANGGMAIADSRTKAAAKRAARHLRAVGGTAIGSWLLLARHLFLTRSDDLRHAILLTDGQNGEPTRLGQAIDQCVGLFSCDCRGVGTDWKVDELREIATKLLGTVDIVPEASGLVGDFEAMMTASMAKEVADVRLRVWAPNHATVRFVKQVAPTVEDLTGRRKEVDPQVGDYPTGAWAANESRDYHICVDVRPAAIGHEMLAARISLTQDSEFGPRTFGKGLIRAVWTDDEEMSTRINRHVAHYTGQAELAQAIQDGIEARKAGDEDKAVASLGRAVALAHESGNEESARLLAKVADVIDPATGTIRLKATIADADEMALNTRSSKTVRASQ
jgi:hypothetical protein